MGYATVLVVMEDQSSLVFALAVQLHSLIVASSGGVGITQAIDDGQQGPIFPGDQAVGPQKRLVAIGKSPLHAFERDGYRLEVRDEMDQINVVAPDVGEGISTVAGKPVLEI